MSNILQFKKNDLWIRPSSIVTSLWAWKEKKKKNQKILGIQRLSQKHSQKNAKMS